jgi:hypothetical protein
MSDFTKALPTCTREQMLFMGTVNFIHTILSTYPLGEIFKRSLSPIAKFWILLLSKAEVHQP